MGGPNTGGGNGMFGQGTSWVPLGLAALGGGLAGASRAGSPASNMGSGLMSSMLGYYANQAATADERARRMKIEDEALQRQKDIDAQNRQVQFGNLAIQSGHGVSMQPVPGAIESTIGGQKVWFTPKQDFPIEAFAQMAETAFPGSGDAYRKSMGLVPGPQRAALAEPMFKASQAGYDRTQTQNLFNTIGALGRPTPNVTPEMELGMGTPPPMNPPPFTQAQVAMHQQAIQFPESRQQAFKTMQEHLAELTPSPAVPVSTVAEPGRAITTTTVNRPGKRPEVHTVNAPENPQHGIDRKDSEWASAEATRLEKSPGYKALYSSAGAAGKEGLTTLLNGAKAGNPAALQTLVTAMTNTGTTADSLEKEKLAYYKAHPGLLDKVILQGVAAGDPNRHSADKLVETLGSQIRQEETDIASIPPAHPTYPAKAKSLAARYRSIADAAPESWGKYAFQRMGELLGWDQATYTQERAAFAAKHGLQTKGVK